MECEVQCDHGCSVIPSTSHAVYDFMNDFEFGVVSKIEVKDVMECAFKNHPNVWNDANCRKMIMSILMRYGTNVILNETNNDGTEKARVIAMAVSILDNYSGDGDFTAAKCRAVAKMRNISHGGGKRDILRFYSRKNPCSCLKKKYSDAKKEPKIGICFGCNQEKERSSLMECNRCKFAQYCSRKCQASDWNDHEKQCEVFASIRRST